MTDRECGGREGIGRKEKRDGREGTGRKGKSKEERKEWIGRKGRKIGRQWEIEEVGRNGRE